MNYSNYEKIYKDLEQISFIKNQDNGRINEIKINTSFFYKDTYKIAIVSIPQNYKDYLKEFLTNNKKEGYIEKIWNNFKVAFDKCVENNIDIVVFPEHSLSMKNMSYITKKAVANKIIIIGGAVPQISPKNDVINQLVTIIPYAYGNKNQYKDAFIYFRDKVYFAPDELEKISDCNNNYKPRQGNIDNIVLFNIDNTLRMVNYNCYELYDYRCRNKYNGECNFITASVNNKDVDTFKNILYSLRIDAFSYVAQSNYSDFGDSMLIAPKGSYHKEVMNIKGSGKVEVVISEINIKELKKAKEHECYRKKGNYKPLPPHLNKKEVCDIYGK